ncbi:LysR family transcriptional regulator [Paenibacillus sp. 7124]|uniref:LysR family transcriptional regulator n=1 Tax=Paenibacillus apii TaxID=1850370 RepID=A0A6M1PHZ3_9BACL|nr:LysR family transcriptional regulator [Paenibacillus apii]NGM82022.1 LysR family transcriptional regulator [Paenibacillus apii]
MELLQLHYFRTVAKHEHMTKAAQELHIAQPALSKTIARLEKDLGVPLFDRQGRQIKLNPIGKAFLRKTEVALSALEEGKRMVADMAGLEAGSIHVASPTLNRLSAPISEFLDQYPDIRFHLSQASTEEMEELLESGKVDFGFTAFPVRKPGIRELPVFSEKAYLAVPPGHWLAERESIDLTEVANEPFIGYKTNHIFRKRDEDLLLQAGITPKFVCEVDEPATKSSLVRAGLGLAIVGACNKSDDAPKSPMTLLQIESPSSKSTFQLVWHEKHYLSKAALAFRDFAAAYYQKSNNGINV